MSWTAWTREQRLSFITIALSLASIPLTALLGWIIRIMAVWAGHDALRIDALVRIAEGLLLLILIVEIALAMVLSIRAFKGTFGKDGATLDIASNGDAGDALQGAAVKLADAGTALKEGGQ